jgi:hypothetical protein
MSKVKRFEALQISGGKMARDVQQCVLASDYDALAARCAELEDLLMPSLFAKAPCFICGYNGAGYFKPSTHPCAARYHAKRQPDADGEKS